MKLFAAIGSPLRFPLFLTCGLILNSCGASSQKKSWLAEAWNKANEPRLLSGSVEFSWDKLPLNGAANQKGWSDDYWATFQGGISYRWMTQDFGYPLTTVETLQGELLNQLSPAEKYDVFMERLDFPTVAAERRRTKIMKTVPGSADFKEGFTIPTWEGLCHGWSQAAFNFKEPIKPVSVKTSVGALTFYPSDIKALLTYYQQYKDNGSTRETKVSNRCEVNFAVLDERLEKGEITKDEWTQLRDSDDCADINAGSFHLILANEIGRKKQGFVIDVTRDIEVWNQPVNSYESKVTSDSKEVGATAAAGTVRELTLETSMVYTVESDSSMEAIGSLEETKTYQYILELDSNNHIIGGRWISDDRPDFIWRQSKPNFRGYFTKLKSLYDKAL